VVGFPLGGYFPNPAKRPIFETGDVRRSAIRDPRADAQPWDRLDPPTKF
jgi:hypothetical protein